MTNAANMHSIVTSALASDLMDDSSVSGTERVPANIDLRRGSILRYSQHRELPWLPSGTIERSI